MLVLGVDPGSAHVGWALVSAPASGGFQHWASGSIDNRPVREVVARLRGAWRAHPAPEFTVAVERITQINARAGFGATMATGLALGHGVGQRIVQAFEDDGVRVEEVTAEKWHLAYFARRAVDGPAVHALVRSRIAGWPTASNNHQRDAGAIALWALEGGTA